MISRNFCYIINNASSKAIFLKMSSPQVLLLSTYLRAVHLLFFHGKSDLNIHFYKKNNNHLLPKKAKANGKITKCKSDILTKKSDEWGAPS